MDIHFDRAQQESGHGRPLRLYYLVMVDLINIMIGKAIDIYKGNPPDEDICSQPHHRMNKIKHTLVHMIIPEKNIL